MLGCSQLCFENWTITAGPLDMEGAGTLFSYSLYISVLTYIQCQCLHVFVVACCHAPSLQTTRVSCITICLYQNRLLFLPTIRFSCVSWRMLGLNRTVSACSDSHTHPPSAKPHQRQLKNFIHFLVWHLLNNVKFLVAMSSWSHRKMKIFV